MSAQWKRSQIRAARQMHLKPVLEALGYRLSPTGQDNFMILELPGEVVIKQHYWVRLSDGTAGNAIDFLVNIEGMSFSKAMELLAS